MSEERRRAILQKAAVMEQQLAVMQNRLGEMMTLLMNIDATISMLLEMNGKESEVFVPVSLIVVPAKIYGESVLFPIGGGYYLEVNREEARKKLEKMREKLGREYEELAKAMKDLEQQLVLLMKEAGHVGST